MLDDFAVFILSHGRPDRVDTYKTLKRCGYTGRIYIVIDNEDKTAPQYYERYGDKVIMFDKAAIAETFDEGDNFGDRRAVIYARNACFEIAEKLGTTYFMQLDDDYTKFEFRINGDFKWPENHFIVRKDLDNILESFLDFYKKIDAKSIALSQGGDFIGGAREIYKAKRKCMNTFICSIKRPFNFVGRINEDVNIYTYFQSLGNLFLSIPFVSITQRETQGNDGGMTDLYLDNGTYIKSFYTVMYMPSSVRVGVIRFRKTRLHHNINWDCTVPCIIREEHRLRRAGHPAGEMMKLRNDNG